MGYIRQPGRSWDMTALHKVFTPLLGEQVALLAARGIVGPGYVAEAAI